MQVGGLAEYESWMAQQELIFPNLYDAEHDGFPPVAAVFDENPCLPQQQLWLAYWTKHVALFDQQPAILPALMCRVYRIYPSLVREHHLYLLLLATGGFDLVLRSRELDANGVDYLIFQDGRPYSVAAYLDTPRAQRFRSQKRGRHKMFGTQIDLPLDLRKAPQVGPFAVYDERHVATVRKAIAASQETPKGG